jgi:hypothetical protein
MPDHAEASRALEEMLAVLPRTIAPYMRSHGRCVIATRVAILGLARFGMAGEALPVNVEACNAAAVQWINEGGPGGTPEFERRGAYLLTNKPVSGDAPTRPQTRVNVGAVWDGHLIVSLPTLRLAADFDLRQVARPEFNLRVPDAVAFPWHERGAVLADDDGVRITYRSRKDHFGRPDRAYETARDWTRNCDDLVDAVLRAMERYPSQRSAR